MDDELIIIVSVLSAAWFVLLIITVIVWSQVCSLRRTVKELQATGRIRVQKLKMDSNDKNHSFHNPALSPEEELSRRGYSIYAPSDDLEGARSSERQTGGQFIEELNRELDNRQKNPSPSFLLQSIQETRKKTRSLNNNIASNGGRQSDTNPNFMY